MRAVRAAAAAVTFLTTVPIGRRVALDGEDVARATPLFPAVGALVGAAVAAVALGSTEVMPPLAAAGAALAAGALLTGGMHLDALADTVDALGARPRGRALDVMRDSRIGSFGAIALTLDLLVKAAALAALVAAGHVLVAAVAAGALSRAVVPLLGAALPRARPEGSGAIVAARARMPTAAAAVALAAVFSVPAGWDALGMLAVVVATAAAVGVVARRRFGGVTGDVLGCAVELSETAALVVAASLA